jgi:predicted MPP superfamily phosphohydrolase
VKFRKLLKRLTLTAAFSAAALGIYSYKIEPSMLKTTTYQVDTQKWPQDMPQLHVVAVSDLHVGSPNVSIERLGRIVERINALKPDVILLPGDFTTMKGEGVVPGGKYVEPRDIAAVLKNLKAPGGVYAVIGNHDVYNDPDGMAKALRDVGITVLANESAKIAYGGRTFYVTGLEDDTSQKPDWDKALAGIDAKSPVIAFMHDPGPFVDMGARPVIAIAGHTHGGQFLPFLVPLIRDPVVRAPGKYMYGHFNENGKQLIVTSGVGESVLPLRLGAPPEVVSLKIGAPAVKK